MNNETKTKTAETDAAAAAADLVFAFAFGMTRAQHRLQRDFVVLVDSIPLFAAAGTAPRVKSEGRDRILGGEDVEQALADLLHEASGLGRDEFALTLYDASKRALEVGSSDESEPDGVAAMILRSFQARSDADLARKEVVDELAELTGQEIGLETPTTRLGYEPMMSRVRAAMLRSAEAERVIPQLEAELRESAANLERAELELGRERSKSVAADSAVLEAISAAEALARAEATEARLEAALAREKLAHEALEAALARVAAVAAAASEAAAATASEAGKPGFWRRRADGIRSAGARVRGVFSRKAKEEVKAGAAEPAAAPEAAPSPNEPTQPRAPGVFRRAARYTGLSWAAAKAKGGRARASAFVSRHRALRASLAVARKAFKGAVYVLAVIGALAAALVLTDRELVGRVAAGWRAAFRGAPAAA